MTREISMTPQVDGAEQDFPAFADQWVDPDWHLPPGGDQSWREQDAERIFRGVGEAPLNDKDDPAPVEPAGPAAGEADGPYQPGFRHIGVFNILLPVSLATCLVLVIAGISVPEILTSGFWDEPKTHADAPVRIPDKAAENVAVSDQLRPSLAAENESDHGQGVAVRQMLPQQALPQQAAPAVASANVTRKTVSPLPRPVTSVTTRHERQSVKPAVRLAKAQPPGQSPGKPAAKSPPPIGAAYFARHTPAVPAVPARKIAVSSRPIGEAYFASHSPTAAN